MWTLITDSQPKGDPLFPKGMRVLAVEGDEKEAARYLHEALNLNLYGTVCECCGQDFWVSTFTDQGELLGYTKGMQPRFISRKKLRELFPNTIKENANAVS